VGRVQKIDVSNSEFYFNCNGGFSIWEPFSKWPYAKKFIISKIKIKLNEIYNIFVCSYDYGAQIAKSLG